MVKLVSGLFALLVPNIATTMLFWCHKMFTYSLFICVYIICTCICFYHLIYAWLGNADKHVHHSWNWRRANLWALLT